MGAISDPKSLGTGIVEFDKLNLASNPALEDAGSGAIRVKVKSAGNITRDGDGLSLDDIQADLPFIAEVDHAIYVKQSSGSNDGGDLTIRAAYAGGSGGDGGDLHLKSGTAGNTNTSGTAYLTGADAADAGTGGSVDISSGDSGSAGGVGGDIDITAGETKTGANPGGAINITAGASSQVGGAIAILGGTGGSSNGGAVSITGGTSGLCAGAGGTVNISGGTANDTADGGSVNITGEDGGSTGGDGGSITIQAGATSNGTPGSVHLIAGAGGTDDDGGNVNITTGAGGATNADGGDIVVTLGAKAGTGRRGVMAINSGTIETWIDGYAIVQIGSNASILADVASGSGKSLQLAQNAYYDSTDDRWEYQDTDEASLYEQVDGTHVFKAVSSGTEDTEISWTDILKMTVDGLRIEDSLGIGIDPDSGHMIRTAKSAGTSYHYFDVYAATDSYSAEIITRKSGSDTIGTESSTSDGENLGRFGSQGVDSGGNFDWGGYILIEQDGSAGSRVPSKISLKTFNSSGPNSSGIILRADNTVEIADLSGSGNRYVYVDSNGVLKAGSAYP